jgi:heptosyltransferase-2
VALLHEAHRVGLLLEPLGLTREEIVAARPWLPPFPWERVDSPWAKALDEMARRASHLIAIAPGSVWGTKRWPADSYAALARALLEKTSSALVLLGGADEVEATGHIARALDFAADRVLDLGGKTSLAELRAIYPRLSLLVSNDSSAVHYATAFGVRTVAVFGATVPAMGFGPLAEGSLALGVEDLACRPCGAHGPAVCPLGHFRCMRELSVERVLEGCLKGYFVP